MPDLASHHIPDSVIRMFPNLTWRKNDDSKTIYLTFDDGPIPGLTEEILAILDDHAIKATFFCVGENVEKHPKVFEKVRIQGHQFGNHTYNHLKAWKVSNQHYFQNVLQANQVMEQKIGEKIRLFRPPYGQMTYGLSKAIRGIGLDIVMWDVLSRDYNPRLNKEKALRKCVSYSQAGSIIVYHDNLKARNNVLDLLPKYINSLIKEGYNFSTL